MSRGLAAALVVGLVAAAVAPGLAGAAVAPAADERSAAVVPVSECRLITEPGHYRLTTDIVDTGANRCINIQASDVYFDGAGHTIDGVGRDLFTTNEGVETATKGVLAKAGPHTNVTVANVVVTDFGYGLWYGETSDGCIMNNTFRDNGIYGLYVGYGADDNLIVNNVVRDIRSPDPDLYGQGIVVANAAHGSVIANNDVRSIEQFGIEIATSNDTTIVNNTVADTGSHGITASNEGNVIRGNVVTGSDAAGILVRRSPGVRIEANTVEDNQRGIALAFSEDAVVRRNVVRRNDRFGVHFHGGTTEHWGDSASPGATVAANRITDNGEIGILLERNNTDAVVRDNVIASNGGVGVRLAAAGGSRLANNTVDGHRIGVVMVSADGTVLEGNTHAGYAEWALLSRRHAEPITIEDDALGDDTRVFAVGRNVAVAGVSSPPEALPEGVRRIGGVVKLWPEDGGRSWARVALAYDDASVDAAASPALWVYDGDWTRREAAVERGPARLRVNLTDLDGMRFVALALGPEPTPTAARPPSPTASRTPTASPGQPGLGFGVAVVALVAAARLARRHRP